MQKLHPRVVWLFFIRRLLILSIFPILITLYTIPSIPSEEGTVGASYAILSISIIINITIVLWFVIAYAWARFSYDFYGYEFAEDAFQKNFGIFSKQTTTIPYDTVKHVDTRQGFIGMMFGLVEIHIETWGKSHRRAEEYLPGLTKETAKELTSKLIKRAHEERTNRS